MSNWIEHESPDARKYWFNSMTNESVWEKPLELMSSVEVELSKLIWKEYETKGRKYWVHSDTKETTWTMPEQVKEVLSRAGPIPTFLPPPMTAGALVAPGFLPSRPTLGAPVQQQQPIQIILPMQQQLQQQQQPVNVVDISTFTPAEAERAFMDMLTSLDVTVTWTWEQTMRETIVLPMYKALRTLAERKAAFEKYLVELHEAEVKARLDSLDKSRKAWMTGMQNFGGGMDAEEGVKSWWGWEKARIQLEKRMPAVWNALRNDEERKTLFNEFMSVTKTAEATRVRELRLENLTKIGTLLQSLSLDLAGPLKWKDVQATIMSTPEWQEDLELQRIAPIDILAVYEEELSKAERESNEERRRTGEEKRRRARKAREAFVALLNELRQAGHITSSTTWKALYPMIESSPAYDNLLGVPGSSPIDLFWDLLDELERVAEIEQQAMEKILEEKGTEVGDETTYDQFVESFAGDERLAAIEFGVAKAVFERLQARAVRNKKEERRKAEKKVRIQIDDLRYAFKKLDPPIDLDASYEDILPRIEVTTEFIVLEDDTARRTAFDKFVKRQKEKVRERDKELALSEHDDKREPATSRTKDSHRRTDRDGERSSSKRDRSRRETSQVGDGETSTKGDEPMEEALAEEAPEGEPSLKKRTRSLAGSMSVPSEAEEGEIE